MDLIQAFIAAQKKTLEIADITSSLPMREPRQRETM